MTILVDTCVLVDALNERSGRRELLLDWISQGHKLASCAVVVGEVYAVLRAKEHARTRAWLQLMNYFEIRQETAKLGGDIKADWAKKGHTLSLTDTLIAAVAIENGLTVATDNVKDFPMPELRLLTPPRPH